MLDLSSMDTHCDDKSLQEFFDSGEQQVDSIFDEIRLHVDSEFNPETALDFGSGIGQILIPLAKRLRSVTGVDLSETNLLTARRNADARGLSNVKLLMGNDQLTEVRGTFDLVYSVIVFQLISVARGERIVQALLKKMHVGSVGVMKFTYSHGAGSRRLTWGESWRRFRERLRVFVRALRGRPTMTASDYSISNLFRILQKGGAKRLHVAFVDRGEAKEVVLMFRLG